MKRFFDKVNKTETCWLWTAAKRGKTGYGAFKIDKKVVDAHRVSYKLHKGDIPKGMLVCHTCDNRLCVNPDHLWLGSFKENYQDAFTKNRIDVEARNSIPRKHPSLVAYRRRGCRCQECTTLNRDSSRNYRKKLKNK